MGRDGRPSRPRIEDLEGRLLLSTLSRVAGVVDRPGEISTTTTTIAPKNLSADRPSTILGVAARPAAGSTLKPAIVAARGPGNTALALRSANSAQAHPVVPARAYVKVKQAGATTLGVTGEAATTGGYLASTQLLGDIDGDGVVNEDDVAPFLAAYPSKAGGAGGRYNAAADLNHNGQVGQDDLRILLRNLPPLARRIPLKLDLHLAPGQEATYKHRPTTLGADTFREDITIVGRTSPGAFVLMDSGLGDYSFRGPAARANARGIVRFPATNRDGINTFNFLVIDSYGQQVVRSFPVYWISRAYQA